MSEEKKEQEKTEPSVEVIETPKEAQEEPKAEAQEAQEELTPEESLKTELKNPEEPVKETTDEDIFVTEKDRFDIEISYYKEGRKLHVETVEEYEYDPKGKDLKVLRVTFKYPSQLDLERVMNSLAYKTPEDLTMNDIVKLELVRLHVLIRGWNLKQEIKRIAELDPKIIKGLCNKMREELGMEGII